MLGSAVIFVLIAALGRGQSVDLHPNCGASTSRPLTTPSTQLVSVSGYAFAVSCFGFQFVSNNGVCTPSTPGYVNLTISQNTVTTSISLSDLFRGSYLASSFNFKSFTTFTYVAYYPDTSCPATLYYGFYGTYTSQPSGTNAAFLVSQTPRYMLPGQVSVFSFQLLSYPLATLSSSTQRVIMIPEGLSCSANAARLYSQTGSPSITVTGAKSFTWATSAAQGMYRMCAWNSQDQEWTVTSLIQVFGGNPVYFKQNVDAFGPNVVTSTLIFSGYGLATSGDAVVLQADDGTPCQNGIKSDATVTINSYKLVDTTHVAVSVSILRQNRPSAYRVCYYVASSRTWAFVPDFDTLPRDVISTFTGTTAAPTTTQLSTTTTLTAAPATPQPAPVTTLSTRPTSTPAPTTSTAPTSAPTTPAPTLATPSPPASCPTAPYNSANIAVTTNQVVAVVVSGSSIPSTFATQVASFLCVTSSAIAITRFDSGDSTSTVYFQVQCSAAGNTCNSAERQAAFLAYYSTASLTSVQSASSQTFSGISVAAASSDGLPIAAQIGLGVGLGVAFLLLIVALVVLGVFIKRRRDDAARDSEPVEGRVVESNPDAFNNVLHARPAQPLPALPPKLSSLARFGNTGDRRYAW